jgi:hypothetical protein
MSLPKRRTSNAGRVRSGIERAEQRDWPTHRKWVRGFACVVCAQDGGVGIGRIECAHVRMGTDGGTSIKPHDAFTLPLCGIHHLQQHATGEATFARLYAKAFPKGMKARALEFARQSPVAEVRERARRESV